MVKGGYFKAMLKFPSNYPYSPPTMRFLVPIWLVFAQSLYSMLMSLGIQTCTRTVIFASAFYTRQSTIRIVERLLIKLIDYICSKRWKIYSCHASAGIPLRWAANRLYWWDYIYIFSRFVPYFFLWYLFSTRQTLHHPRTSMRQSCNKEIGHEIKQVPNYRYRKYKDHGDKEFPAVVKWVNMNRSQI